MRGIHKAIAPADVTVDRAPVYKIDIAVAGGDGALIGPADNIPAAQAIREIIIRSADEDDRQFRLLFAHDLKKRLVRLLQKVRVRRIVIVIIDKNAHIQPGNVLRHLRLGAASARKAEVDKIRVQPPGEHRGIAVAGMRGAAALRDGAAVEDDGLLVGIRRGGQQLRALVQPDIDRADVVIQREMDQNLPHPAVGKFISRAVAVLAHAIFRVVAVQIQTGQKHIHIAAVRVQIKAAAAGQRHVGGAAYLRQLAFEQNAAAIRAETDAKPGGVPIQKPQRVVFQRLRKAMRQALKILFARFAAEPVKRERRLIDRIGRHARGAENVLIILVDLRNIHRRSPRTICILRSRYAFHRKAYRDFCSDLLFAVECEQHLQ